MTRTLILAGAAILILAGVLWLGGMALRPLVPTCARMGVLPQIVCLPGVTIVGRPAA